MRFAVLAAFIFSTASGGAVEIIAHRGASEDAPENTLSAVNLGWKQNADAVEIDVALSKDGQIVVHHDRGTGRLAGRDKPVEDQTFAELRQLDVGGWKGKQFRGERIPLLSEVLATIPDGKRLFVELKGGPEEVPAIADALAQAGIGGDKITIVGFRFATVSEAKRLLPEVPVYWISRQQPDVEGGSDAGLGDLIAKADAAGLDGLNLQAWDSIDAEFVRAVKDAGLELHVWTVDDPAQARRLAAAGFDGITTNRPGLLREELGLLN